MSVSLSRKKGSPKHSGPGRYHGVPPEEKPPDVDMDLKSRKRNKRNYQIVKEELHMKSFKKLSAILLAGVMMLGMSASVMADSATLANGKVGSTETTLTDGVAITKQIIFVNDEATAVREPNITYEYTVAAVTVASTAPTVNDGSTTVAVKSGVLDANTNSTAVGEVNHKATVVFSDDNASNATVNGTADSKTFTLTFDPTKFDAPGVYRYSVTESISAESKTKTNVGITEASTYASVRYLDVYVKRVDSSMAIYGYVLFESSDATSQSLTTTSTEKSNGWIDTDSNDADTIHSDVDVYKTHNLEINKTTTGTMADKTHRFDFSAVITLTGVDGSTKLDVSTTGAAKGTAPESDAKGSYISGATSTYNFEIKDGERAEIKGIPESASVVVTETNDSTDTYKVKATSKRGNAAAIAVIEEGAKASEATAATNSIEITDKIVVAYTNTLDAISPTGVVLRYAPYLLILATGIVLLALSRRRRNAD